MEGTETSGGRWQQLALEASVVTLDLRSPYVVVLAANSPLWGWQITTGKVLGLKPSLSCLQGQGKG